MKQRKLFCSYGPVFYQISLAKEYLRRDMRDAFSRTLFSRGRSCENLPVIVKSHRSLLLRPLDGVDMALQQNKVHNLALAIQKLDGITIHPGETFSFWRLTGPATAKQGYLPGLTISGGRLGAQAGGGLCQLANLIHWLVLHSPLAVTELHHHTDAVFPDCGRRVPFGTGTSIFYKNVDYRFFNGTGQEVQLRLWLDDTYLNGELRAPSPYPCKYRIEEDDHHFEAEDGVYYRNSKIYRSVVDRQTRQVLRRELLLRNHSRVLYDPALIPPGQLRQKGGAPC